MLDKYLEALREKAGDNSHVSFAKLASMAGIHTSGSTCPECGGEMVKSASILKCACGMMKSALSTPAIARVARWAPLAGGAAVGAGTGALAAGPENRMAGAMGGGLLGAGIGGGIGGHLANNMTYARLGQHGRELSQASHGAADALLKANPNGVSFDALQEAAQAPVDVLTRKFTESAAKRNLGVGAVGGAVGGGTMLALRDPEKHAAEEMVEPGLVGSMKGMMRAQRRSGSGAGQLIASPEVIKARLKGMAGGAAIGAGIGGGVGALGSLMLGRSPGLGAAGGAVGGGLLGQITGAEMANRGHLKSQGIHPKWHGLTARFTPEAVQRFLPEKQDMLMGHQQLNPEDVQKMAEDMSLHRRESLPKKDFAIAESTAHKEHVGVEGEAKGAYPIPDKKHARVALGLVGMHGTPEEKAQVKAKVHSKYPELGHEKSGAAAAIVLIAEHMQKHAELWQPGVLEQGHAGTGEKLKLLPALGDTPDDDGSRREEQLGARRHQEASGVAGGTETGTRDIGVGPSGLTYELTNAELVKKAAAGMPGRRPFDEATVMAPALTGGMKLAGNVLALPNAGTIGAPKRVLQRVLEFGKRHSGAVAGTAAGATGGAIGAGEGHRAGGAVGGGLIGATIGGIADMPRDFKRVPFQRAVQDAFRSGEAGIKPVQQEIANRASMLEDWQRPALFSAGLAAPTAALATYPARFEEK